jgi:hypothetical protein
VIFVKLVVPGFNGLCPSCSLTLRESKQFLFDSQSVDQDLCRRPTLFSRCFAIIRLKYWHSLSAGLHPSHAVTTGSQNTPYLMANPFHTTAFRFPINSPANSLRDLVFSLNLAISLFTGLRPCISSTFANESKSYLREILAHKCP